VDLLYSHIHRSDLLYRFFLFVDDDDDDDAADSADSTISGRDVRP
jgi:hypothetical protein